MNTQEWIAHVEDSIQKALKGESKLDDFVLGIGGFSTPTMRHLFNNLGSKTKVYTEVGLYRGGTACAAMWANYGLRSYLFEDESQTFGEEGVFEDLKNNLQNMIGLSGPFDVYFEDFFNRSNTDPAFKTDMAFYDGEHSEESQRKAVIELSKDFDDVCLLIVDDAQWDTVQEGTRRGLDVISRSFQVNDSWFLTDGVPDGRIWHNGVALYLLEKL